MADYTFKTWETMNVDVNAYWDPVQYPFSNFLILDGYVDIDNNEDPSNPPPGINIIYSGVRPNTINIYNNLENILSPKLTMQLFYENLPLQVNAWNDQFSKTFYIYESPNDWELVSYPVSVEVIYDWSYIPNYPYMSEITDPIEYKIDPRQYLIWTSRQLVPGTPNRQQLYINGVASSTAWFYIAEKDFNYNICYKIGDIIPIQGTGTILNINSSNDIVVIEPCKEYCLYYLNKFGGWDWLLVNGTSLKTDKLNRLSYKSNYLAQYAQGTVNIYATRNKIDYTTIINENWELNTSWLSDIQSSKMSNLLESNQVVLHDLKNNYLIPVLITNSNVDYKTYKNQGRKLYSYKIEVEASKPKYRL